ncbi:PadR family transcriptional regulator [Methanosphaerula palustris]|uniref:Transcriptional regulator, PadR-like family n=1 Tax=Methanosphaerula palustris (strain ATCC BAA-1556 / DSM 19958 / E1-9c) TaxID=521011 RepID=B8GI45_METPE|nr:PadR family transcriptional regulator [Methanosphaerula palustris]ACL16785.1 transcriptional regulator, PadR-like family [Methanosphaerula palustris E1-9c]
MMEHNFKMGESHAQRGPGFDENEGFNRGPQERDVQGFCDREYGSIGNRGCRGFGDRELGGFNGRDPHGFGGHGGRDPRGFGGFGGGRGRLFDAGDIKLAILNLLSEQPSYGYQIIKTMEQRLAGGYAPSPGVIYPTLTMLEEEGLATVSLEGSKKVYSVTPEGMQYLQTHEERVKELFERLEEAGRGFQHGRSPELMKAFKNLHGAVMARLLRGNATPEQISTIAETMNAAARTIDDL